MKPRFTWGLVSAALVMFSFIWFVDRPIRLARLRDLDRKVLPGFLSSAVTAITIRPATVPVDIRVERQAGRWFLVKPVNYPAFAAPVESFLTNLAAWSWQVRISPDELRDRPHAQEEFGLTKPQFTLTLDAPGSSRKLLIGQTYSLGDKVYTYVDGSEPIYLCDAGFLTNIPDQNHIDTWRDTGVLDLTNLPFQAIQVRSGANKGFDIERLPGSPFWRMKWPLQARADSPRVDDLLNQLASVRVIAFVTDDPQADGDPYGLPNAQPPIGLQLTFLRDTNAIATLRIGAPPANALELVYARRASPPNIIVLPRAPFRPWQDDYTNFLDLHLLNVPPALVSQVEVQSGDPFTLQRHTNGQWFVHAGQTFLADQTLADDWIASFSTVTVQIEKTVVADLSAYGLTNPPLQYTIKSASNSLLAHLQFGARRDGKIFERDDEPFVNSLSADDFDRLPAAPWQLRDRRIWNFDSSNVLAITIQQAGNTRKFIRDPNNEWTFAPGSFGIINPFALDESLHRLGTLTAIYWSGRGDEPDDRFGFDKTDLKISFDVNTPSGVQTHTIRFGKPSPYLHPYACVIENGRRMLFEFPVDIYENFVKPSLTIPPAFRQHH